LQQVDIGWWRLLLVERNARKPLVLAGPNTTTYTVGSGIRLLLMEHLSK
jgi:hypothetical protein